MSVLLHSPNLGDGPGTVVSVTPADAGWSWCGISVHRLAAGVPLALDTGESECFVLPLAGSLEVAVGGEVFTLEGRDSVFTRVSDFAYVGRDSTMVLTSAEGAEVAVPAARCHTALPARYGPAEEIPVETRGAGSATRQVTNFGIPGVWDHAEKLICCELITPDGNWSSYPPHKHDLSAPCEVVNEEIYYYRLAGSDQVTPGREGIGYHRTYTTADHEAAGLPQLDELIEVRDHDVVLVPHGYHGPCMSSPGYPMYYLNVMAGPADDRRLAFCDDPDHGWVRETWTDLEPDPRCPVTSAQGRVQPTIGDRR